LPLGGMLWKVARSRDTHLNDMKPSCRWVTPNLWRVEFPWWVEFPLNKTFSKNFAMRPNRGGILLSNRANG
jgi:hypothetical protein